jgi:histidine triad (HIT) family protein
MEITDEQIEEFRKQIIQQIESTFSEEKKEPAIERVNSMNKEEFIEFLQKNKLLKSENSEQEEQEADSSNKGDKESPFRLIIEEKIPSYKIDENKASIAVLEIKPISKGHIIIIPKEPIFDPKKIPKPILTFANKISKKIKKEFGPKEVLISPSHILGEVIINIIPVYSNESHNSPRKQASQEELEELKITLGKKQKTKTIKTPKIKKIEESKMWFPRRIP